MSNAFDVAAYILSRTGPISAWKLQKLVYYSQAWRATWRDVPLFNNRIEAWANGPVCPDLYNLHRGQFTVSEVTAGNPDNVAADERQDIDGVVEFYSRFTGQQLSDITHAEKPWLLAREGLPPGVRGNHEITLESLTEYYGSIQA